MSIWHTLESHDLIEQFETDPDLGLSPEEALRRLTRFGPNELEDRGRKSPWRILGEQFTSSMVVILIVAAVISIFLGDEKDALAILIIVVLNAFLGFRQEFKAEKAMAALKALAVPVVRVVRRGEIQELSARDLVPGDILLLETGNIVPADGRILESMNLRSQEAALTGESEPVEKDPAPLGDPDAALANRRNMVYMGTVVAYGRGRALVTETGMETELGRIASMIQTIEGESTPLQRRLDQLGRGLALAALVLVAVVFTLGVLRGEDLKRMFLVAISMAVAAVPEGLPAVVTIALALGSQRMLKRRALIRKLPAVETLGSVTVICSDKTGTLTENRMTVTVLELAGHEVDLKRLAAPGMIPGSGSESPLAPLRNHPKPLGLLLAGGALCNDAVLQPDSEAQGMDLHAVGDPTETALVLAASRFGLWKSDLEQALPRIAEAPFDSTRKRMTTVHRLTPPGSPDTGPAAVLRLVADFASGSPTVAFTKGAVDSVLEVSCSAMVEEGRIAPLDQALRERVLKKNDLLAGKGMRVLGLAFRPLPEPSAEPAGEGETLEEDLVFLGLAGMIDPARPEAKEAVAVCKSAGVRPVMITGDHPLTARSVARELGLSRQDRILTGRELALMSSEDLKEAVEDVSIFARVTPEHKLNIVQALQDRHHIVAMTGDGVNDAPALKKADIGVAMGITGTDVTKEVADMVLLDDNFATIVEAVEEGRVIYDNIRKFMKYLLTTNSGEIWVMLIAPFLGMPLPLLPLQILWINLVTDGLPALALALEPAEPDIMRRPPTPPRESVFGRGAGWYIVCVGWVMGLVPLGCGYAYWRMNDPAWQTMVFNVLTLSQMSQAMAIRCGRHSLFTCGLLTNKPLLGAVLLTCGLQALVIYMPFFQEFLGTTPLTAMEMLSSFLLATLTFWGVEAWKWMQRMRESQTATRSMV